MTDQYHALVWIDHQQARIFHVDADSADRIMVRSSHPHLHLHHKKNASDSGHAAPEREFLESVTLALSSASAILITGPASAKTELAAHIRRSHPGIAARICGVEALDHPSDAELVALARRFFARQERMQARLRGSEPESPG